MPNPSNITRNLVKNASWLFSGGLVISVFSSAEAVILARFLGIDQFGLFSLIIAYVGIVNEVVDFKSSEAGIRYVGEAWERGEKNRALSFIKLFYIFDFMVGVVALGACVVFAGVANDLFIQSEEALGFVLIYSLSILVSNVNRTSEAFLRVFDRFRIVAFVRVLRVGLRVILVCLCLFLGFGIEGVLVSYVIATFVFFVALQVTVSQVLRQAGLKSWVGAKTENLGLVISEIRSFVLTSTVVGFLGNAFSRQFPVLLLGHFTGHEAAGLYKVATIFSRVIIKLRDPLNQAIYPSLVAAQQSRNSLSDFARIVSASVKHAMKFFLPVGAVFFLFASELILIFFGAEYQPAAMAMRIIVISEVLSGFYFWIDGVELALDRIRRRMVRVALCSALYVTALFLLVPSYSYQGAAIATLVPSILIVGFSFFLFKGLRNKNHS